MLIVFRTPFLRHLVKFSLGFVYSGGGGGGGGGGSSSSKYYQVRE
jgi:hypothetical protein